MQDFLQLFILNPLSGIVLMFVGALLNTFYGKNKKVRKVGNALALIGTLWALILIIIVVFIAKSPVQ